jgi:hypothetical protein
MLIYLDTKNYVDLIDRNSKSPTYDEFLGLLKAGNHKVALSVPLFHELIRPLWDNQPNVVVTRTMNMVEALPHTWLDLARLPSLEVARALESHVAGVPYLQINPFCERYQDALLQASPYLRGMIGLSLAEAAFDTWNGGRGSFSLPDIQRQEAATYRQLVAQERQFLSTLRNKSDGRRKLIARKVAERIQRERMLDPSAAEADSVGTEVGRVVASTAGSCSGLKVVFEAFHAVTENLRDKLQDGDLMDMAYAGAIPYVDHFVADRRMYQYLSLAARRACVSKGKIWQRLSDLVPALSC